MKGADSVGRSLRNLSGTSAVLAGAPASADGYAKSYFFNVEFG